MDSGGWIAIMMIGGTAIVCLLAFSHQTKPITTMVYRNGFSEAQHIELDDLRRENRRLRDEVVTLKVAIDALVLTNDRLRRRISS